MKTPARVTQRCLREDLTDDWDDTSDQRLVQAGQAGRVKAVHLLRHKLIQKAVDDFPVEGDTAKKRESITGLTKPPFWKVKIDRWRGAAYEDEKGQVWLVAAGRRYAREGKDFYKRFMADVEHKGASFFLPSEEDLQLYKEEQALRHLEERERQVQTLAIDLLRHALSSEERYATDDLVLQRNAEESRVLAHIELMVDVPSPDQPATPHSILIEISNIDWSYYDVFAWDEQVLLATLCPQEDRWGTTQTDVRLHSIDVSTRGELDAMTRGLVAPEQLGHFAPGLTTHTVHRARLTEHTVIGEPVHAVCGRWFVPRQDHENKPQCETCLSIVQTLGLRVGSSPSED